MYSRLLESSIVILCPLSRRLFRPETFPTGVGSCYCSSRDCLAVLLDGTSVWMADGGWDAFPPFVVARSYCC